MPASACACGCARVGALMRCSLCKWRLIYSEKGEVVSLRLEELGPLRVGLRLLLFGPVPERAARPMQLQGISMLPQELLAVQAD